MDIPANSMRSVPNVSGRGIRLGQNPQKDQKRGRNIFDVIRKYPRASRSLEVAYKFVQDMPQDIRKAFLRACEGIK